MITTNSQIRETRMPKKIDPISIPLLLEFSTSLPASPRIFTRLSSLVQNEDTGLDYVASIVKMDPGLTAHLLRVTNSAYYGSTVKLTDIESAIARIGLNEVHKVLCVIIAHDSFYQALPSYGVTATEYADECIAVGVASEVLAKRIGIDMSAPYIAGLLHAIGKLAINLYLERLETMVDLQAIAGENSIYDTEMEVLGVTSWQTGFELLRHWQFEPEIWQPVRQQESPTDSDKYHKQTAILTFSIWITRQFSGFDFEDELPPEIQWALPKLGIDPLDVASLIDEARFEFNDRQNLFSMLI